MSVKTTGREFFYSISGLAVPKYKVSDGFTNDIESFVDWVNKKSDGLKDYTTDSFDEFIMDMEELYELLCKIYAHWLEMEAARILRMTEIKDYELCHKLAIPFITNLKTLGLDIQMSQNNCFESSYRQREEIERCKDVINSVKIIFSLVKSEDFASALDISLSINELKESKYSIPLFASITGRNRECAKSVINEISSAYKQKIEDIIKEATETIIQKHIMIVDDMPEILTSLRIMLKEYYHVSVFSDGLEALEYLDAGNYPDAFILDIEMPEMDGFTLAERITSRSRSKKAPIIFLTGDCSREAVLKSAQHGAKAFILKPASKDIIISKLSRLLEKA